MLPHKEPSIRIACHIAGAVADWLIFVAVVFLCNIFIGYDSLNFNLTQFQLINENKKIIFDKSKVYKHIL